MSVEWERYICEWESGSFLNLQKAFWKPFQFVNLFELLFSSDSIGNQSIMSQLIIKPIGKNVNTQDHPHIAQNFSQNWKPWL